MMCFSRRAARMRNLSVAVINGVVTLVVLLVAPLGLAVVIVNTVLVAIASYVTGNTADLVMHQLTEQEQEAQLLTHELRSLRRRNLDRNDLDRF